VEPCDKNSWPPWAHWQGIDVLILLEGPSCESPSQGRERGTTQRSRRATCGDESKVTILSKGANHHIEEGRMLVNTCNSQDGMASRPGSQRSAGDRYLHRMAMAQVDGIYLQCIAYIVYGIRRACQLLGRSMEKRNLHLGMAETSGVLIWALPCAGPWPQGSRLPRSALNSSSRESFVPLWFDALLPPGSRRRRGTPRS